MRYLACLAFFVASAVATPPAIAFTSVPPAGLPSAADFSSSLLPDLSGVVSWKTLAQLEPVMRGVKMVPQFSKDILALDQQLVRIYGFMMPLDIAPQQQHFLLSAVPATCPYCMPAGPAEMVEVISKRPVKFGFEPIIMAGRLSMLKDDESGMLYRLSEAESVAISAK
jgi:hypothetical protein